MNAFYLLQNLFVLKKNQLRQADLLVLMMYGNIVCEELYLDIL